MKTVIMAGGKGTRIASIASDIPKPMIPIHGIPVLEREIENLKNQGFTDIIITVSHLGNIIMDYFGNGSNISPITGRPFEVNIKYFIEETPLGNAGALFHLKNELKEDFLLLNADVLFDIDFNRFVEFHKKHGGLVTLFTHPNNHPFDSGLIIADENGTVKEWLSKEDKRPKYYKNRVNAGLHVVSPKILDIEINTPKVDLDKQLLKPLAGTGEIYIYDSPEYVRDMGTPDRYYLVEDNFSKGIIEAKNLKKPQKAVFLDRDGTINKYRGFIKKTEEFELIPGVSTAIKRLNEFGYLVIVITNQPVIARGETTIETLNEIHNKMETLLGNDGAYLDAIYYCPHHPHKGYQGEITELKIECECRKPKPGLILQASKDLNINLKESYMIGDSEIDILAGNNAGCKTILINNENKNFNQTILVGTISEAVDYILVDRINSKMEEGNERIR